MLKPWLWLASCISLLLVQHHSDEVCEPRSTAEVPRAPCTTGGIICLAPPPLPLPAGGTTPDLPVVVSWLSLPPLARWHNPVQGAKTPPGSCCQCGHCCSTWRLYAPVLPFLMYPPESFPAPLHADPMFLFIDPLKISIPPALSQTQSWTLLTPLPLCTSRIILRFPQVYLR